MSIAKFKFNYLRIFLRKFWENAWRWLIILLNLSWLRCRLFSRRREVHVHQVDIITIVIASEEIVNNIIFFLFCFLSFLFYDLFGISWLVEKDKLLLLIWELSTLGWLVFILDIRIMVEDDEAIYVLLKLQNHLSILSKILKIRLSASVLQTRSFCGLRDKLEKLESLLIQTDQNGFHRANWLWWKSFRDLSWSYF